MNGLIKLKTREPFIYIHVLCFKLEIKLGNSCFVPHWEVYHVKINELTKNTISEILE